MSGREEIISLLVIERKYTAMGMNDWWAGRES